MRHLTLLVLVFSFFSCATRSGSSFYTSLGGSLVCGTLGIFLGGELSPDRESVTFNRSIGAGIGAASCGLGGYYLGQKLYDNDPRNQQLEPIKFNKPKKTVPVQQTLNTDINGINLSDLKLTQMETIDLKLIKGVPKELQGKILTQKLIKYKVLPQTIKTKDGRTLYYSGGTAIEHLYNHQ
jgi:hypothetical protein